LPLSVSIDAAIIDPGRAHVHRAGPCYQLPRGGLAVADDLRPALRITLGAVAREVLVDLRLERRVQHAQRARRSNSSSDIRRSGFSSDDFSTTLNMGGVSFSRLLTGMCVWNSHEGYAAFRHSGDPQHSVISQSAIAPAQGIQ